MELAKVYEAETGEKALYRKEASYYHTLRYVRWLENRVSRRVVEQRKEEKGI